ncbi:MAG TPA: sigma-70 family RNA polymerase sigma factor [Planctomycetaceae bacterium]|nr:sigma-70 family RNA polymerase sigma factor [Planctomycetaceae bacterium]
MAKRPTTRWSAQIEQIYRSQGRELWALLYAQCNDADRAQDALQEAFARLHEQNGAPIRDLRAWLLRVGRNWLRDVARRQRVAARPVGFLEETVGPDADPADIAEQNETRQRVREALAKLKIEDREVLVLRYGLSWSSQRIAEVLESTAAAIDMRLSRARRRLAEILDDTEQGHAD